MRLACSASKQDKSAEKTARGREDEVTLCCGATTTTKLLLTESNRLDRSANHLFTTSGAVVGGGFPAESGIKENEHFAP